MLTKESIIKKMKACGDSNITRNKFCIKYDIPYGEILTRFSGFRNLRKEAGVSLKEFNKAPSKETAIEELKKVFSITGIPVTMESFDVYSKYEASSVSNLFGGWRKACSKAGVVCGNKDYSRTAVYNKNVVMEAAIIIGSSIQEEKSFDGLINPKTGCKLRYDFYLPESKILIEVDGWSHSDKANYERVFKNNFEERVACDSIKTEYAEENGYKLIRIKQRGFGINPLLAELGCKQDVSFNACDNALLKNEKTEMEISREKMLELYVGQKMSDQEIADVYGVDYNLIYRLRKNKYQIVSRSCKTQKTKIGNEILLKCLKEGMNQRAISRKFNVSPSVICFRIKKYPDFFADFKSLKKTGNSSSGQSDLKAIGNESQGQRIVGKSENR